MEADVLSRHSLLKWDFRLLSKMCLEVCHKLSTYPTLDAFASRWCHLLPRYMTWEQDDKAVVMNALTQQWDRVNWMFSLVPLIATVLQIVPTQQIEAILICLGWTGVMWWPWLSNMRVQASVSHEQ